MSRIARDDRDVFRFLVQEVVDYAIFVLDLEGNISTWNAGAERLKQWDAEEVIGRHFSIFYPPDELTAGTPKRLLAEAASVGRVESEGWRVRRDGSRFWANVVITALTNDAGEHIGFAKITRDLTERRRTEQELRQLSEELSATTYAIAHDLRSPLRALDGYSAMLIERYGPAMDDNGRDKLRRIRAASQRMGAMMDALLVLAQIGRGELRHDTVDLAAIARQALDDLRAVEPHRQVLFVAPESLPVTGDQRLLGIALANLVGNAWKFTRDSREAVIELGVRQARVPTFFVRDNGAGFAQEFADQLFRPFSRLHSAEDFEGTGIGLATVRRIVGLHGGRIWAEGTPSAGATFSFTLEPMHSTAEASVLSRNKER